MKHKHILALSELRSFLLVSGLMSMLSLTVSCSGTDELTADSSPKANLTVATRADATDLSELYPIHIYAEDASGNKVDESTITAGSETTLLLPIAHYTLYACSGDIPAPQYFSRTPVLHGNLPVTLTEAGATANIDLKYSVAKVCVTLTDVPASVSSVSVSLASHCQSIDYHGQTSGTCEPTVICSQTSEGLWTTGEFYVLPGSGSTTSIKIKLINGTTEESYTLSYSSPLKAATPYEFTGAYQSADNPDTPGTDPVTPDNPVNPNPEGNGTVAVTFNIGTWNSSISQSFSFGPGASSSDAFDMKVSEIPAEGTVWNGHVVLLNYPNGDALLISLEDRASMKSALSDTPNAYHNFADGYYEGDLRGWTLPTESEAMDIMARWANDHRATLNNALAGLTTDLIAIDKDYLCAEATKLYSFKSPLTELKTPTKSGAYRARLVRKVHFTLVQ